LNLGSNGQSHQLSLVDKASSLESRTDRQFLRFQVYPNLMALIEIEVVTELLNILIDRVVPMPHLPPAVMGVYNWRGEILWIVDLAMLLGTVSSSRRYRSLQPTIILTSTVQTQNRQEKIILFFPVDSESVPY
jgi:positive phototaxis protein PixI